MSTASETEATASPVAGPPPAPVVPTLAEPWSLRLAEPAGSDLRLVHAWMQNPHVEAYWHQDWPVDRWRTELRGHHAGRHTRPCLAEIGGAPVAYVEIYRVALDRLAAYYPFNDGDLGVHVAVGEAGRTGHGLGRSLLRALAEGLLAANPECDRVVAEPDSGNVASLRAFEAAGFVRAGEIDLPDKTAALLVRARRTEDQL